MCDNQCCAYLGNKRCINKVVGSANHCNLHRVKATKLYLKYKSLCEKVENLDLYQPFSNSQDQMNYVMDCYNSLNKAYKARQKHRQYAFVPECYDEGHLHQFVKLNKQMQECEKILSSYKEDKQDEVKIKQYKEQNFKIEIKHQIKDFKKYRREQEAEINQLINHYIDENKILLKKRSKLIGLITSYVDDLYDYFDDDIEYFVKHIITFNLVNYLCRAGYFRPNFKPERCSDITCGCYIPYDAVLACSCVLNNHSVNTYFNLNSENSLGKYYEIILLYKSKILPILNDVMDLYQEHGDSLMFLKVHLLWHYDLGRLVLEPDLHEELPKMSKLFAQSRLKNKFYYQKMQQEYLTGK